MTDAMEIAAQVSYERYFENLIGCCEEPWDKLPQEHRDRLVDAQRAGINAYEQAIAMKELQRLGQEWDND